MRLPSLTLEKIKFTMNIRVGNEYGEFRKERGKFQASLHLKSIEADNTQNTLWLTGLESYELSQGCKVNRHDLLSLG